MALIVFRLLIDWFAMLVMNCWWLVCRAAGWLCRGAVVWDLSVVVVLRGRDMCLLLYRL